MSSWQPIATAPFNADEVLVWIASAEPDGEGWIKIGTIIEDDPLCLLTDDDGRAYWPHENGGYPTHWMPLPPAPVTA